jgi:hypothetical protein
VVRPVAPKAHPVAAVVIGREFAPRRRRRPTSRRGRRFPSDADAVGRRFVGLGVRLLRLVDDACASFAASFLVGPHHGGGYGLWSEIRVGCWF